MIGAQVSSRIYRLSPYYAGNEDTRQTLLRQALACISAGAVLTLDVPENANALIRQLPALGLRKIFHTVRIYRRALRSSGYRPSPRWNWADLLPIFQGVMHGSGYE
ncbi:hypothetical protein [Aquitalea magnusonii]|uniref:hypothetical protein n=1 Tax=Aquitalea magnusonii TaxID=332411 RepID=UPI00142D4F10